MDELNHSFGQLSTSAAEWKPASSTSTIVEMPPDSDLRASALKEFVPGQGWVTEPLQEGELLHCTDVLLLVWVMTRPQSASLFFTS